MSKLYADRNPRDLEPHYSRHIQAMTAEGLHDKADIAAELAWRDREIERLKSQLEASVFSKERCLKRAPGEGDGHVGVGLLAANHPRREGKTTAAISHAHDEGVKLGQRKAYCELLKHINRCIVHCKQQANHPLPTSVSVYNQFEDALKGLLQFRSIVINLMHEGE